MAKKKKNSKKAKTNSNRSKLITYNANSYMLDMKHIFELGRISESRKDWIETTMLKLRSSANCYEIDFAAYLMEKGIRFVHQAPFIFDRKIYFADFYIPSKRAIFEIDGQYHDGMAQSEYDEQRSECFEGNRIKVIRIPNAAVYDKYKLDIYLSLLD